MVVCRLSFKGFSILTLLITIISELLMLNFTNMEHSNIIGISFILFLTTLLILTNIKFKIKKELAPTVQNLD